MNNSSKVLSAGIRSSKLSLAQTREALTRLERLLPALKFTVVEMSSPGDRDRQSDLRQAPPDFFTRDLDEAVINGKIDCAIHSAKDMPEPLAEGLDFFYLPWRQDQRDALVLAASLREIPPAPRIGVSSERRAEYCRRRFPESVVLPVRGNIEQRLEQLDSGKFDLLIMAAAALNRLGLSRRVTELISLDELPTPSGQGCLAFAFKRGNRLFEQIRGFFVNPVIFAGAGPGMPDTATLGAIRALRACDVCLHDALASVELLEYLPRRAMRIDVGKRNGRHSRSQQEINALLATFARQGKAVVRLKGGDPGIFGRLAEEIAVMDEYKLSFRVLSGVSSLTAATSATGLLLTRRGGARGFVVAAPRQAGSGNISWFSQDEQKDFSRVYFMATDKVGEICANLTREGIAPETPAAIVYGAGTADPVVIAGVLADVAEKAAARPLTAPGIIIVGKNADGRFLYSEYGALGGMRVLFAGSRLLYHRARHQVERYGGKSLFLPMLELTLAAGIEGRPEKILAADWLVVPSPSCAELLLELLKQTGTDLRSLPPVAVCGSGSAAVFRRRGIFPDIMVKDNCGTTGLIAALRERVRPGEKVIKLCSDKALSGSGGSRMRKALPGLEELHFYDNKPREYTTLPDFDAALFTSSSAIDAFVQSFTAASLENKIAVAIGEPSMEHLRELDTNCNVLLSRRATVDGMVATLAAWKLNQAIGSGNAAKARRNARDAVRNVGCADRNALRAGNKRRMQRRSRGSTTLCRAKARKK